MKIFAKSFLSLIFVGMILSFFNSESAQSMDLNQVLVNFSGEHIFGTDSLGRDLFWRILQASQISIGICLASSVISLFLGFLFGTISAFSSKWIDQLIMRLVEVLISTPHIINLAIAAIFFHSLLPDSGLMVICLSLAICGWMPAARFIRNRVLKEKYKTYIEAAQLIGNGKMRTIFVHIFPNIKSSLIIYWGLMLPQAIVAEGILSFLGLGVKSPMLSWGSLLQEGWKTTSTYPHLILSPAIFLLLTVFSINLLLEDWRRSLQVSQSFRENS